MGCWNGTCGLSQLPLFVGDEVLGFVVRETGLKSLSGGGTCYADTLFTPITLGIEGIYNDYGSMESIRNEKLILPQIQYAFKSGSLVFDSESRETFCEDLSQLTLEMFVDWVERGAVYAMAFNEVTLKQERCNVGLMMASAEVINPLLREESIQKNISQRLNRIQFELEDLERLLRKRSTLNEVDSYEPFVCLRGAVKGLSSYWCHYLRLKTKGIDTLDLCESLVKVEAIQVVLEELRRSWMPQTGAGSQSGDELHRVLAQMMLQKMDRRQNELDW